MPALLTLHQTRLAHEVAKASCAEAGERLWRRAWFGAYLQCVGLMVVGYALFGVSWALPGDTGLLISALAFVVAYALPFFRLIAFFLRHADQF